MKKILLALLFLPLLGMAQTTNNTETIGVGLRLEQGSWKEILAKAKAENKFIIMDCMTTWCGPCKHMDKNIFPLKETGDFFNEKFLAVKVQFDSTANDDARVQAWRKDMKEIEKAYAINAYPTYLIFDPNGEAVHRSVGATPDAAMFIAKAKEGLTPETQYYTQLKRYKNGEKDPAFLRKMATIAGSAYDTKMASTIANEYIAGITDFYTKENATFVAQFTNSSKDKGFDLMLNNPEKMDALIGEGKSKARVMSIIGTEELNPGMRKFAADRTKPVDPSAVIASAVQKYPQFTKEITEMANKTAYNMVYSQEVYTPMSKAIESKEKVNWETLATAARNRDAKNADEMIAKGKVAYYQNTKDWTGFQSEVVSFMNKYGIKATPAELNSYAWTVFENCKDMNCVTEALDWSKRSFADNKNPMFMDTYANILHKLGKTKEAIEIQGQAIALTTDAASKKSLQETLEKMKKGEKTWSEE